MSRLLLPDSDATEAFARVLARLQPDSAVVHLRGDLGAGKSTLARAWLRSLGVHGAIRSPTYTLVERYALADGREALHLDLYRIGSGAELEFLGLDDVPASLWLIEWPERGADALPAPDLHLTLAMAGEGRLCDIEARSDNGRRWIDRLEKNGSLRLFAEP